MAILITIEAQIVPSLVRGLFWLAPRSFRHVLVPLVPVWLPCYLARQDGLGSPRAFPAEDLEEAISPCVFVSFYEKL